MEMTIPPGIGPPRAFRAYVLDGQVRHDIGGEVDEAGPGTVSHIPAETQGASGTQGDGSIRVLLTYTARRDRQVLR